MSTEEKSPRTVGEIIAWFALIIVALYLITLIIVINTPESTVSVHALSKIFLFPIFIAALSLILNLIQIKIRRDEKIESDGKIVYRDDQIQKLKTSREEICSNYYELLKKLALDNPEEDFDRSLPNEILKGLLDHYAKFALGKEIFLKLTKAVNFKDSDFVDLSKRCLENGYIEYLDLLMEMGKYDRELLHKVASADLSKTRKNELLRILLDRKFDLNAPDKDGKTPLQLLQDSADYRENIQLAQLLTPGQLDDTTLEVS